MSKVLTFNLDQSDIDIIYKHNHDLNNPGRSAALRSVVREWSSGQQSTRVTIIGRVEDGKIILYQDSTLNQSTPETHPE